MSNPRKVLFPRPATPSSISSATTSPSPTARCAGPAAGRTCCCGFPTASTASRSTRSARPSRGRRGSRWSSCRFRPAARRTKSCRATPPRWCGWPTWPASSCIRIRCAPRTSITPTRCASTSIRCRASSGRRCARWPASCGRRSPTSASSAGPRRRARAACTSTCASSRAGASPRCAARRSRFAREVERRAPALATSKWWKEERHGVFLDYNQNAKDRTIAAAYSVRPKPDARVSAPLAWDEVDACEPADFTLATMPARFADGRRSPSRHRRASGQPRGAARAVGAAGEGGPRRRAVAAALPQAAGRGAARGAVEAARAQAPADRDRPGPREGRRAGGPRALEGAASRGRARTSSRPTCSWMRCAGGSRTWTRIRVNLQHVPEALRPAQEALDPDDDVNDWPSAQAKACATERRAPPRRSYARRRRPSASS